MPDSEWLSVSASQAPALFNQSRFCTKYILWHAFRNRDRSLIEKPDDNRMRAGRLLQHFILAETATRFRLEMVPNLSDTYERRGQLGATIDGHLIAPDVGEIVVEAKNVAQDAWYAHWSETAAPMEYEIQLQQQLFVRRCPRGIIAAWVGGNEYKAFERDANPEIQARLVEEAALFFESLAAGKEPDALGNPLELPALAALYPQSDPAEVLDAPDDTELGETLRLFDWARGEESFAKKVKEGAQAKILARAGTAGVIRAPGAVAYISKSPTKESRQEPPPALALAVAALLDCETRGDIDLCIAKIRECWPNCWPVTRKASIQTRIKITKTEDTRPAEMVMA